MFTSSNMRMQIRKKDDTQVMELKVAVVHLCAHFSYVMTLFLFEIF